MKTSFTSIITTLIVGLLGGLAGAYIMSHQAKDTESLIADFYATENAIHVSPHGLRKKIQEGKSDFVLVDLRSAQEYEKEHIVGAVSIPAYSDPDHSAYDDVERIVSAFKNLPTGKSVIVYCYSMPCMTGRKIGQMLVKNDIFVQHLGIGWNEWRHFWTLWNHEHEWATTNVKDFVASGKEPGTFQGTPVIAPCTEGAFGC